MVLWKVKNLPLEDAVRPQLQDEDKISQWSLLELSEFFSDLDKKCLHVVIQPPLLCEL